MALKCTLLGLKLDIARNLLNILRFFVSYKQLTVQSSLVAQDGGLEWSASITAENSCAKISMHLLCCALKRVFMHITIARILANKSPEIKLRLGIAFQKPIG